MTKEELSNIIIRKQKEVERLHSILLAHNIVDAIYELESEIT